MNNPKNTQINKIKADLLARKPVNSVTAFKRHRITRLSALIYTLRQRGLPVVNRQKRSQLAEYAIPDDFQPGIKKPR